MAQARLTPVELWHGSREIIGAFDHAKVGREGFHFGTPEQARARNSVFLHRVKLDVPRLRRSWDDGSPWRSRIASARSARCSGIVYLNRFEGLVPADIARLKEAGIDPSSCRDRDFLRIVPTARDSVLVWDETRIRILEVVPGPGTIEVWAPVSPEAADEIIANGYDPDSIGPLEVSTLPRNAGRGTRLVGLKVPADRLECEGGLVASLRAWKAGGPPPVLVLDVEIPFHDVRREPGFIPPPAIPLFLLEQAL